MGWEEKLVLKIEMSSKKSKNCTPTNVNTAVIKTKCK